MSIQPRRRAGTANPGRRRSIISRTALSFDGVDDHVKLLANPVSAREFTVMGWARYRGQGGGAHLSNIIFSQKDPVTGDNHPGILLGVGGGAGNDGYAGVSIRSTNGSSQSTFSDNMGANTWHHYAVTVNNDEIKLYIDADLKSAVPNNQSGDYFNSNTDSYLGHHAPGKSYFNGDIDNVRIFNRALSGEEIQEQYQVIAPAVRELN